MAITGVAIGTQDQVLNGDLVIRDANGIDRIRLDRETGGIFIKDSSGNLVCHLEMPGQNLRLGGHGNDGDLLLFRRSGDDLKNDAKAVVNINADTGVLRLGGDGAAGRVVCRDADGNQTVLLDGTNGRLIAGANGQSGFVDLQDAENRRTVRLTGESARIEAGGNGQDGELRLRLANGSTSVRMRAQGGDPGPVATLEVGGNGASGAVSVLGGDNVTICALSPSGALTLGSANQGPDGKLLMHAQNSTGIDITGDGRISAGAAQTGGELRLHRNTSHNPAAGAVIVAHADSGTLRVGGGVGSDTRGRIDVRDQFDNTKVLIDGEAGDITFSNGDIAEQFAGAEDEKFSSGSVVVLDQDGNLRLCRKEYDWRAAGIIAGAGGAAPAIVLGRKSTDSGQFPVALAGRVFCRVDANDTPVEVGDLLTTSSTPGHAMKADMDRRLEGALIGKALAPLAKGAGLVPVLVMMR